MKLLAFAVGFVALAAASSTSMPDCAASCLTTALGGSACSATDVPCICADTALMANTTGCVLMSCMVKEALTAHNVTSTMCGDPVRDITLVTPIVTGIFGGLAILAVLIRSLQFRTLFGAEDVFTILSLVSAIPMAVLEFFMSHDGFGKDIWTIPFDKINRIIKFTWLTEIFYMASMAFTKMAFLCLYLRIFPNATLRKIIYALLAVCGVYLIVFVLATTFNCLPVSYIWTKWTGETQGHCFNFNAFAWSHAAINIVLDLIVIVLPLPEIAKLSLNWKKKLYVLVMFSMGFFITVVSIIRLRSLVVFATSSNATYDNVPTAYWSVIEAFVGIICICMPAVRRLLSKVFPACFGSTQHDYHDTPIKLSRRTPTSKFGSGIVKTVDTSVTHELTRSRDSHVNLVQNADNQHGWEQIYGAKGSAN